MPALNPPSMQIGVLPPGFTPFASAGPALGYGFVTQPPSLIQQAAAATTVATPATLTVPFAATQPSSFLVACVAYATSAAPSVPTPAGWTPFAIGTNPGATLGGRIFVQPNNPGALTSLVLASLTNMNGVAAWVGEFANAVAVDAIYGPNGAQNFTNSSTGQNISAYAPTSGPVLLVGFQTDVTGQVYTPANVGANWVAGTTAQSTTGATVCIIRPFYVFTSPLEALSYQQAGSLAGAIANGACGISVLLATGGPLQQPQPQGTPGPQGWQGWGALGGTKPGGAGGGQ